MKGTEWPKRVRSSGLMEKPGREQTPLLSLRNVPDILELVVLQTRIPATSGATQSIIHSPMLTNVTIPIMMSLVVEIGPSSGTIDPPFMPIPGSSLPSDGNVSRLGGCCLKWSRIATA